MTSTTRRDARLPKLLSGNLLCPLLFEPLQQFTDVARDQVADFTELLGRHLARIGDLPVLAQRGGDVRASVAISASDFDVCVVRS